MRAIAAEVERLYELPAGQLLQPSRTRTICVPRQVATWIMHRRGAYSLHQIGAFLGQHHTTVLHAVQRIDARIGDDEIAHVKQVVDKMWITKESA
jgi:chromosomal replication initiation ATPase DnaA